MTPVVDAYLEPSSFAWRKGKSRDDAARAIARAEEQGYRFAIRADFDRFFDTIDRGLLLRKVSIILGDARWHELIAQWVCEGMEDRTTGVPTGSPLSPLLGNLLLDSFDEWVEQRGGKLIRYADDFMVLCKSRSEAEQWIQPIHNAANQLLLRLNESSNPIIDTSEPFEFLGFEFRRKEGRWDANGAGVSVQELGRLYWYSAKAQRRRDVAGRLLPGEVDLAPVSSAKTLILGPHLIDFRIESDTITGCLQEESAVPFQVRVEAGDLIVFLGVDSLRASQIEQMIQRHWEVLLADSNGNPLTWLNRLGRESPSVIEGLVEFRKSPDRLLAFSRELISCKLHNFSVLARVTAIEDNDTLGQRLYELSIQASQAENLDSLRGIEGFGARIWYGGFSKRLGNGFVFPGRQSPDAEDPINAMLNAAHTILYQLSMVTLMRESLPASLGVMHVGSNRYAALASDMQETFRHLAEWAVIRLSQQLHREDFQKGYRGNAKASRMNRNAWLALYHEVFSVIGRGVRLPNSEGALSYRQLLHRQARSLRACTLDIRATFRGFRQP